MEIKSYLPGVVKDIREFNALAETEEYEFGNLRSGVQTVWSNQFILNLNEVGCRRWEKLLGIKPMDTDTVEERRFKILAKVNESLPYTRQTIEDRIKQLCGEGNYSMEMVKPNYKFIVRVGLTAKKNTQAIVEMLDRITPCNLILDVSLLYNQYSSYTQMTYADMQAFTCQQLREEEVI